jgi:putative Ca2+/H+ antiporter (TMEM165/GDT1 family)
VISPQILAGLVEGLIAFGTTLGLIALLEIGDKTQLVTISLATRYPWAKVLGGAAIGLTAATAIGAAVGGIMAASLSAWLMIIKLGGGILFVVLGVWPILVARRRKNDTETSVAIPAAVRSPLIEAASVTFLAEFGDKTQIAVIILAATYVAPLSVFAGASLAETLVAVTSVIIGTGLARLLTRRWIEALSTALFIIAGALLILDAFGIFS